MLPLVGRHVHEGNLCSGVFYAQLPATASPLYLSDPRGMPRHHEDFPPAGSASPWQSERLGHFLRGEATVPPFTGEVAFAPRRPSIHTLLSLLSLLCLL